MAKTAVVNPRRKRKRKSTRRYGSKRRRNPTRSNPRRRRARRRNPTVQSVYSRGGYRRPNPRRRSSRRRRNPEGYFDVDKLTEVVPAATLGVQAARFAFHLAGPFTETSSEVPSPAGGTGGGVMPGIKHAIAAVIAAQFGGKVVGDVLGSDAKGQMASIAALGWAGDQFLHKRFMANSKFAQEHLYLGDADGEGDWEPDEDLAPSMNGFESSSAIGEAGQLVQGQDGQWYQLAGFESSSAIGSYQVARDVARPGLAPGGSSFGYSRC